MTRGARSQVQNVETSREGHRQEETAAASERVLHESTTPPSDSMPEPADSTKEADASTKFWPSNLLDILEEVVKEQYQAMETPNFCFEMTQEAALKNFCVLKKYSLNLGDAIEAQSKSPVGYGSEFRPPSTLERIF